LLSLSGVTAQLVCGGRTLSEPQDAKPWQNLAVLPSRFASTGSVVCTLVICRSPTKVGLLNSGDGSVKASCISLAPTFHTSSTCAQRAERARSAAASAASVAMDAHHGGWGT
jgi:hypothetical protein